MKKFVFILYFSCFCWGDDKVVLNGDLLPKLNFEVFENKRMIDKLKSDKKEISFEKMVSLLTDENNNYKKYKK